MPGGNDQGKKPETALEEVLREAEEAERHGEDERSRGEAADAITPSTGAQERSEGD
ncbi:hypothetical protein ABZ478_18645 [Streptomyces sp. NPDC005706]|uniref:hypothetical protein n=1 Tax=Streptomyces sp. NPDC005706 TaxID=3157169 RepID=UPI0034024F9B